MSALSFATRKEYYTEICNSLPPTLQRDHETRIGRMNAAGQAFDSLHPADSYEARLAVQIVLCGAHAADSLRQAAVYRDDFAKQLRCRAQAVSLMREERAAKRMLDQERKQKLQAAEPAKPASRPAQPPVPVPAQSAPAQPAGSAPAQSAPAQPAVSVPTPPAAPPARPPQVQAAAAAPQRAGPPRPVQPLQPATAKAAPQSAAVPPPSPAAIAQAEAFAQQQIVAAAQIRHDRGITPQTKARFGGLALPTDPAVIDALVRGNSDLLSVLDELDAERLDKAA